MEESKEKVSVMLWTPVPQVLVPVVYFPLWGKSFLLLANDSFAFQVSEICTAVLIIQLTLSQNGEGMRTVVGHNLKA